MDQSELAKQVLGRLAEQNPEPETELKYDNGYQLAVAVVLSAQCTDKRVNMVTPDFFQRFPDPKTLADHTPEEIFEVIRSVSYPNNKSKHLVGMARMLVEDFDGEIPEEVDQLEKLPGVGRKTANVIASVLYGKHTMAVDTHVFRVSNRIGLTKSKNPRQTEAQLLEIIPGELLYNAHHWLILHGRYVCKARKPLCSECSITDLCAYYKSHSEAN